MQATRHSTSQDTSAVLVAGATGALGRKVVRHLVARGRPVRALVRPGSDARAIEGEGVEIVRGDLMDPPSLVRALTGADALVTTAAGYTKRRKGDSDEIDRVGNRNLVAAAAEVGLRRFVLTSILTADRTPDVPHFWHKKLVEDELEARGVPFVALRPGAFLDQSVDFVAAQLRKGRMMSLGNPDVPLTYVYTEDLARYLAEAVDLPREADGQRIDIGWDRPVSQRELRDAVARRLGREPKLVTIPWWFLRIALGVAGAFSSAIADVRNMLRYFQTGQYVADTELQARYFDVPSVDDAVGRWIATTGLVSETPR